MFWSKKKKEPEEESKDSTDDSGEKDEEEKKSAISGNLEIELTKIKSQLEALNEVRKANSEQFTRLSEQIGELRGALMDSNKAISVIEMASTKAIDMVNSVQPDKLMIEVRKTDGKVEALRANIEANESIMKDILRELKEMRSQMSFYKGVDQVVKMNNEIKQELIEIKKSEGTIGKHADKVETIFVEVEKKFYDFDKFNDVVKDLDRSFKKISTDFDKMRVSVEEKADKKELMKLIDKFTDFEKHTSSILKLLDQRSKNTLDNLNYSFNRLKDQLEKKYSTSIDVKPIVDEITKDDSKNDSKSDSKNDSKNDSKSDSKNDQESVVSDVAVEKVSSENLKKENVEQKKKSVFGLFKK